MRPALDTKAYREMADGKPRADEQTTHAYAILFAQLGRQGTPIPTNDL